MLDSLNLQKSQPYRISNVVMLNTKTTQLNVQDFKIMCKKMLWLLKKYTKIMSTGTTITMRKAIELANKEKLNRSEKEQLLEFARKFLNNDEATDEATIGEFRQKVKQHEAVLQNLFNKFAFGNNRNDRTYNEYLCVLK